MNLEQVADELTLRVISIFQKNEDGTRRSNAEYNEFYKREGNEDLVLFFEYFHGDSGKGLGASHQTGWTAVVADLINQMNRKKPKPEKSIIILDEDEEVEDDD